MERVTTKRMALYSGRTHLALAEEIADHLGVELGDPNLAELASGELRPRFPPPADPPPALPPFSGSARQDRKAEGREPITARLVADLFKAAGAKRMISIDLHAGQIQGFFDGPVDHLTAMPALESYIRKNAHEPVIVSPDAGRIKVAERMAQHLGDL